MANQIPKTVAVCVVTTQVDNILTKDEYEFEWKIFTNQQQSSNTEILLDFHILILAMFALCTVNLHKHQRFTEITESTNVNHMQYTNTQRNKKKNEYKTDPNVSQQINFGLTGLNIFWRQASTVKPLSKYGDNLNVYIRLFTCQPQPASFRLTLYVYYYFFCLFSSQTPQTRY